MLVNHSPCCDCIALHADLRPARPSCIAVSGGWRDPTQSRCTLCSESHQVVHAFARMPVFGEIEEVYFIADVLLFEQHVASAATGVSPIFEIATVALGVSTIDPNSWALTALAPVVSDSALTNDIHALQGPVKERSNTARKDDSFYPAGVQYGQQKCWCRCCGRRR